MFKRNENMFVTTKIQYVTVRNSSSFITTTLRKSFYFYGFGKRHPVFIKILRGELIFYCLKIFLSPFLTITKSLIELGVFRKP